MAHLATERASTKLPGESKMNRGTFCSRKGGATIGKKFYPAPRTSMILADALERQAIKMEGRARRRQVNRYRESKRYAAKRAA